MSFTFLLRLNIEIVTEIVTEIEIVIDILTFYQSHP